MKLIGRCPGNLVTPFLVKGKGEAARAYIRHMKDFVKGKPLRMPVQIPMSLQPLMRPMQAPGIWLEMPSREEEPSPSCALVGKVKDCSLMLKKLDEIESQVCSSEMASPDITPAHYGKAIGKGGARLKYIYEKFKVWVSVPTDGKSPITVSGESSSVRGAIKELEELVQQNVLKQSVFLPVNILPGGLGVAIGKGGSHAAKVKEEFGIKLHTKAREHPESLLVIEGLLSSAEKVMPSIELHVADRRRLNEELAERS